MASKCAHCAVTKGPAIKELRRDAFLEALKILNSDQFGPDWTFDDVMSLACYLIGLGEEEDD